MKKLLVIVDMQNDFIDGSLGTIEAKNIVKNVKNKIEKYIDSKDEIIFTLDTHFENYLETQEGKNLPIKHCIKNSEGWQLHKSLQNFNAKKFEKNTFASLELSKYISKNNYSSIELVGLCTDVCVISNALLIKATVPEIPILVDSKCCAGVTVESHKNALDSMKMCQIQVI